MIEYHKIQSVFLRDPETKYKTFLIGEYSRPEFEYLKDNEWVFTEKVDGTNIRVNWDGIKVTYGGRTDRAQIPADLVNKLFEIFPEKSFDGVESITLYGEGYGAGIQKGGGNYQQEKSFVLFDVRIGDWWLQRADVEDVAERFDIKVVPILATGTLIEMVECARVGISSTWGSFTAEGIVARPYTELHARNGQRIITKIKCKDFPHERN